MPASNIHRVERCADESMGEADMRYLWINGLLCLAFAAMPALGEDLPDKPFITVAEGSACMGDDKSRKQTEEIARKEAKRRAAEQALSHVRSESVVRDMALEKDLISAFTQAKVRVLDEMESKWDREGCYRYRIRAEVRPDPKAMERMTSGASGSEQIAEEVRAWRAIQGGSNLTAADEYIQRYPRSQYIEAATAQRALLVTAMTRAPGPYIAATSTVMRFKPKPKSAVVAAVAAGDALEVGRAANDEWAEVKRDYGVTYVPFMELRPVGRDELAAWELCQQHMDVQQLQAFLGDYPNSPLGPRARQLLDAAQSRLVAEASLSQADKEEIAFWNMVKKTRDMRDVREYRRRWAHGKFDKESLSLMIELTSQSK
jgi:hypothetical protein